MLTRVRIFHINQPNNSRASIVGWPFPFVVMSVVFVCVLLCFLYLSVDSFSCSDDRQCLEAFTVRLDTISSQHCIDCRRRLHRKHGSTIIRPRKRLSCNRPLLMWMEPSNRICDFVHYKSYGMDHICARLAFFLAWLTAIFCHFSWHIHSRENSIVCAADSSPSFIPSQVATNIVARLPF